MTELTDLIPGLIRASLVAEGGQAWIYRGLDQEGRWVAVKLLKQGLPRAAEAASRLRLEAELLRRFSHRSIPRLLREGELEDGRTYYLTPWFEGETLADCGPILSRKEALRVMQDVIDAVGHAHRLRLPTGRGVVHRDLHLRNVLVTVGGRGVVLDFGAAKPLASLTVEHATHVGELVGADAALAPELRSAGSAGAQTSADVWALGKLLQFLRPQIAYFGRDGQFERLLKFCLAEDPNKRYQDADELKEAFASWRAQQRVPAPRTQSRRWKFPTGLAAGLALVVLPWISSGPVYAGDEFVPSVASMLEPAYLNGVSSSASAAEVERLHQALEQALAALRLQDERADQVSSEEREAQVTAARVAVEAARTVPWDAREVHPAVLLDFFLALAELDAWYRYTPPQPPPHFLAEVDRRQSADPSFCQGFWLSGESDQFLQRLRSERDEALAKLIRLCGKQSALVQLLRMRVLLQEARLPHTSPRETGFGLTVTQLSELRQLLSQLEEAEAPAAVLAQARARINLDLLWSAGLNAERKADGQPELFYAPWVAIRERVARELSTLPEHDFEADCLRAELILVISPSPLAAQE